MEIDTIASLQNHFDFDVKEYTQLATSQLAPDDRHNPVDDEFNLFSTDSGPVKISLADAIYPDPAVNRNHPREYYFTDPYVACV